jgi:hypothetical protein
LAPAPVTQGLEREPATGDNSASQKTGLEKVADMRTIDEVYNQLQRFPFRRRFRLQGPEREYVDRKSLAVVMTHAIDFVDKRLAPAYPANDGKQTPMRKHPVFVAQHATATCCRGCLEKWHSIPEGRELSAEEKQYVIGVIRRWLDTQIEQ